MWARVDSNEIQQHPDTSDGWDLENECYMPIWHDRLQMPLTLIPEEGEVITNGDENDEEVERTVSSDDEPEWTEEED